jgi:ABC-type glutathione transport system ATPase component
MHTGRDTTAGQLSARCPWDLSLEPRLILADEPTSALDVSVQAQIFKPLKSLRARLDLSYLFISHNLDVVQHVSHAAAVIYVGRIVEVAPTEDLMIAQECTCHEDGRAPGSLPLVVVT